MVSTKWGRICRLMVLSRIVGVGMFSYLTHLEDKLWARELLVLILIKVDITICLYFMLSAQRRRNRASTALAEILMTINWNPTVGANLSKFLAVLGVNSIVLA